MRGAVVLGGLVVGASAVLAFAACEPNIPREEGAPRYYIPPDADPEDVVVPPPIDAPPHDAGADADASDAGASLDAGAPRGPTLATGADLHPDPLVGNGDHTCVALADAGLFCWGANEHGQLGVGTTADAPAAVRVTTDENGLPLGDVGDLALAGWHSCARRGAQAFCWGQRFSAAQAEPPSAGPDRTLPRAIGNLAVARVAAGGPHTCAIEASGAHVCFGHASLGELGAAADAGTPCTAPIFYAYPGETAPVCSASLVPAPALSGLSAIAAGELHSCAIANGRVLCWGANEDGQLGRSVATHDPTPGLVMLDATTILEGATAIASGGKRTCAIAQKKAICWGDGLPPAPVAGVVDPIAIGVGAGIACAIQSDKKLVCWEGALADAGAPAAIALDDVAEVAPGLRHVCARKGDRTVWCWGKNDRGQLGDGTKVDSAVPVKVAGLP